MISSENFRDRPKNKQRDHSSIPVARASRVTLVNNLLVVFLFSRDNKNATTTHPPQHTKHVRDEF